jgi:hypothetical protein
LDHSETHLKFPLILDITLKIENQKEKGRSYSKSIIGNFIHSEDKFGFYEFILASKIENEEFILDGKISIPLTLLWINVYSR